tara:strand:+ start:1309 stop:1755 length:447 start_codon:yes stop_codon:yes gene_type:complete
MSENKSEEPALVIYGDQTIYWTHRITAEEVKKAFVEQVTSEGLHFDKINAHEKMSAFVRETYATRFEGLNEQEAKWLTDELVDEHYEDKHPEIDKYQEIINEYVGGLSTKEMLDALHEWTHLEDVFDLDWSLAAATDGSRIRYHPGGE